MGHEGGWRETELPFPLALKNKTQRCLFISIPDATPPPTWNLLAATREESTISEHINFPDEPQQAKPWFSKLLTILE